MAMPWTPESRVSLFNLIPQSIPQKQTEYARQEISDEDAKSNVASDDKGESTQTSTTGFAQRGREAVTVTLPPISKDADGGLKPALSALTGTLPLAWLTGALALAIYVCASNFNLLRIVKRQCPLTDQKILDLLEDCKVQMGIRTILAVVTTDKVKSPALLGFVRPRLLLPDGMIEALSREELRYVLLHELAHLKRHDIYVGWLMSLLQVLHWFNPLVWLAFYRIRADRELACDALVLARTQSDEPKSYGRIIVSLVERFSRPQRLPSMAGILETKAQLKRRITMITRFKKNSYQWSPLAIALIILLACVSLPDAKRTEAADADAAKPTPGVTLRRVEGIYEGYSGGFPSISSDGKYMCDVDWETGDLVARELATGKERRLTEGRWEHCVLDSAISRDSKEVAYLWWDTKSKTADLCTVGLDGSGQKLLLQGQQYLIPRAWSADGKKILVILFAEDETKQMVWVSTSDGSIKQVRPVGKTYPGKFDVSPDGRYIA